MTTALYAFTRNLDLNVQIHTYIHTVYATYCSVHVRESTIVAYTYTQHARSPSNDLLVNLYYRDGEAVKRYLEILTRMRRGCRSKARKWSRRRMSCGTRGGEFKSGRCPWKRGDHVTSKGYIF